jgi:hypothetical protein
VFVDSRFYSLVSVIWTMETLLGLPLMNNNDAFSSMTSDEFTRAGEQGTFVVDYRNQENGLSRTTNDCECEDCEREDCECKMVPGAKESAKMDFRHADRADAHKLTVSL